LSDADRLALRAYRLLGHALIAARPGMAAAIATGDEDTLDRIERLEMIHAIREDLGPVDEQARGEAAFRKMWPGEKQRR
jgi:hypothetical protein